MHVTSIKFQLFQSHGALYKVLGELNVRQGLYTKARELFDVALDQDAHYAPVYHAAALLEAKLGNLEVCIFETFSCRINYYNKFAMIFIQRLSELHRKAKNNFKTMNMEPTKLNHTKSTSTSALSSSDVFDIVDTEHQENEIVDIMEKIRQLEVTTEERVGKD